MAEKFESCLAFVDEAGAYRHDLVERWKRSASTGIQLHPEKTLATPATKRVSEEEQLTLQR